MINIQDDPRENLAWSYCPCQRSGCRRRTDQGLGQYDQARFFGGSSGIYHHLSKLKLPWNYEKKLQNNDSFWIQVCIKPFHSTQKCMAFQEIGTIRAGSILGLSHSKTIGHKSTLGKVAINALIKFPFG